MSNLLTTIQRIAVNAVKSTNPVEYCFGTVTSVNPLKVRLNESTLEVWGDTLMLTSAVVERKLTIKKHTHEIGDNVANHTHPFSGSFEGTISGQPAAGVISGTVNKSTDTFFTSKTEIVDTVLDAFVNEHGDTDNHLPVEIPEDKSKIVVTINRGLQVDDKVIMLRVCGGQKFVILSRVFKRDDESE